MEKQLIEGDFGWRRDADIQSDRLNLFRHRLWKACSKRCPDWRGMPPSE